MATRVLLIGGNSGIGLETARLLQARGVSIVAAARTPGPLEELDIPVQPFDATNPGQLELPPELHGLVYFPGSINLKPFHRLTREDFLRDYEVNLLGAVAVSARLGAIKVGGLSKVLIALFVSPLIGFAVGFLITRLIYFLAWNATPGINNFFKRGQIVTAVGMALVQGTNDAQKTMGVITLCLVIGGSLPAFNVPEWVIAISAASLALGAGLGGRRLIRTLGGRLFKIRPVHSFSTQLSSGLVILSASLLGVPVSATHVASSVIIGVGSSERLGKIRWGVAGDILTAWIVTIPASALLAAGAYFLVVNLIK